MSKLFRIFLTALAACVTLSSVAHASRQTPLPVPHAALIQQKANAKPRTPFERLFLPHLQTQTSSAAKSRNAFSTSRMDTGTTSTTPNFGGFVSAPYYPARLESSCIADPYNCGVSVEFATDLNKDGKPDIAIVQSDGILNVLLNNGSGGFGALATYSNPNFSTTSVQQAFVSDVNNDGYPDIVVLDTYSNTFIVYPNLKNGTFGTPTATSFSISDNLGSVAIGDVNGDGYADIVMLSYNSTRVSTTLTVQTFLGSANLAFAAPTAALVQTVTVAGAPQTSLGLNSIALGDINKDGKLDIALELWEYSSQGTIIVTTSLGKGDGSFSTLNTNAPITAPFQPGFFFPFEDLSQGGVKIADVNNDGNLDLTAEGDGTLLVALGNGSGGFNATTQSTNIGSADQYLFADVNGDNIPDLIQEDGNLNVWTGKGDGTFTQPATGNDYIVDPGGFQSASAADFDGDGKLDVAHLGEDYKQVSILFGTGSGSLYATPALASSLTSPATPFALSLGTVADVQGKGYSSVVSIDGFTGNILTGLGDGKGNFTYVVGLAASDVSNLAFIEPVAADFNGDGKQDIVLAGVDGSLSVALSKGDGTFSTPASLAIPTTCPLSYAATGDVNGDGVSDVVVAYPGDATCSATVTTGSGYYTLLGKGNGSFAAPAFNAYGSELYSVAIADMNQDGKADILTDDTPFVTGGTFSVDLLPGNGDGTFGTAININTGNMASQVIAGDFNQDGKPDAILLSEGQQNDTDTYATAGIVLIPGNGDGTFAASSQIATGNFFLNGVLADVNNDSIPDLTVALYQTPGQPKTYYGLSTLLGTGGGSFSNPVNQFESLASTLPLVGNFFSDNAPDIVAQTGYGTALFLGQGGSTISLTSSSAAIDFGSTETFTATVAASMTGRPAPTGTVTFYDGTTLLGTAPLSTGSATYTTSTLAVGAHSITAVYSGDSSINPVTSSATAVTVTTLAPAFTMTSSTSSLNLSRGQNGVISLSLAANATFNDTLNFTCSGAPTNTTCTVNPTSLALTPAGTGTVSVVIGTTTPHAANTQPAAPFQKASGIASLASVFCLVAGWRFRKRMLVIAPVALLMLSLFGLSGCGGSSSVETAKAGTYKLTITATPVNTASAAQTTTVSLIVQ